MILTVTLNPSVDISYKLDAFQLDTVNRVQDVMKTAGGKGINVSRVLKQLGEEVAATGFLGGSLGDFIRQQLKELSIQDHFVACHGETRNCIAVIHEGKQTEILEGGPTITNEQHLFVQQFKKSVAQANLITISGSYPKGLSANFYNELLAITADLQKPVLLDTSGDALKHALENEEKPFLIKPNEEEIAALLKIELKTEQAIIKALENSLFAGVEWIVVTLGANGALVKHEEQVYRVAIPKVKAINPVGSGDSVIAGFASGLAKDLSTTKLIRYGITMGLLNAMEEKTGTINPTKIEEYMNQVKIIKI